MGFTDGLATGMQLGNSAVTNYNRRQQEARNQDEWAARMKAQRQQDWMNDAQFEQAKETRLANAFAGEQFVNGQNAQQQAQLPAGANQPGMGAQAGAGDGKSADGGNYMALAGQVLGLLNKDKGGNQSSMGGAQGVKLRPADTTMGVDAQTGAGLQVPVAYADQSNPYAMPRADVIRSSKKAKTNVRQYADARAMARMTREG